MTPTSGVTFGVGDLDDCSFGVLAVLPDGKSAFLAAFAEKRHAYQTVHVLSRATLVPSVSIDQIESLRMAPWVAVASGSVTIEQEGSDHKVSFRDAAGVHTIAIFRSADEAASLQTVLSSAKRLHLA